MGQCILNEKGSVLRQQTLRAFTSLERYSEVEQEKQLTFDKAINTKLGNLIHPPSVPLQDDASYHQAEDDYMVSDYDEFPNYDRYLQAEMMLSKEEKLHQLARIIQRYTKSDGTVHGKFNQNPILDTQVYDITFNNITIQHMPASCIALSMHEPDGR